MPIDATTCARLTSTTSRWRAGASIGSSARSPGSPASAGRRSSPPIPGGARRSRPPAAWRPRPSTATTGVSSSRRHRSGAAVGACGVHPGHDGRLADLRGRRAETGGRGDRHRPVRGADPSASHLREGLRPPPGGLGAPARQPRPGAGRLGAACARGGAPSSDPLVPARPARSAGWGAGLGDPAGGAPLGRRRDGLRLRPGRGVERARPKRAAAPIPTRQPAIISDWRTITWAWRIEARSMSRPL